MAVGKISSVKANLDSLPLVNRARGYIRDFVIMNRSKWMGGK